MAHKGELVILVDPYSTGCMIGLEFAKLGYKLIALWTKGFAEEMKTHIPLSCQAIRYYAEVDQQDSHEKTLDVIRCLAPGFTIASCIAAGEAGVDFADAFSEYLGMLTNGTDIPNRRDKKVQQELVKAHGLRSVRQACSNKFEDVEEFLRTEEFPVVLKPLDSAGSDGVKLCYTFEEAKEHFHLLMKTQMVNGPMCEAVLCQEFLKGKEYVVDHVSRNGVHKTMMTWVYDKRNVNDSAFVYFGTIPVLADSEEAKMLIPYVRGVLDAMGIKHGPSHAEVIMTKDGPCLVEMNCRAHGGDGVWRSLATALSGGYSQIEGTTLAFVDPDGFNNLPDVPPSPFKACGQNVDLVCYKGGIVKRTPGYDVIRHLPSFVSMETWVKLGTKIQPTIDLITSPASIILMHKDAEVLNKDLEFIRFLQDINGLYEFEENVETPPKLTEGPEMLVDTNTTKEQEFEFHPFLKMDGPTLIKHFSSDGPHLMRKLSNDHLNLVRKMSNDRPELGLAKRMTKLQMSHMCK